MSTSPAVSEETRDALEDTERKDLYWAVILETAETTDFNELTENLLLKADPANLEMLDIAADADLLLAAVPDAETTLDRVAAALFLLVAFVETVLETDKEAEATLLRLAEEETVDNETKDPDAERLLDDEPVSFEMFVAEAEATLDLSVWAEADTDVVAVIVALQRLNAFAETALDTDNVAEETLLRLAEEETVDNETKDPDKERLRAVVPVSFETPVAEAEATLDLSVLAEVDAATIAVITALPRLTAFAETVLDTDPDAEAVRVRLDEAEVVAVDTTATTPSLPFETEPFSVATTVQDAEIFVGCAMD